jgi:hypothetical protein
MIAISISALATKIWGAKKLWLDQPVPLPVISSHQGSGERFSDKMLYEKAD